MTDQKAQAKNVTLYPDDWQDIETVATVTNVRSTSAALRQIIQEWRTIRQMYYEGQLQRQKAALSITDMATQEANHAAGTGNNICTAAV